ncbi:MAG: site-specific DNA-methyltransferase [Zoogloeaceae bacterium]|jgi:SAM-dependent methyltransferase|nr:site-specific DNA-methyltransferase [Zoogloeaceae bacterium]
MFADLESARLNVENKTRSNLFGWRGQFTPQFVDYLLETYARPGQVVLDPFCGSGTVLREATSRHLMAVGLEINPAACAMAKFFSLSALSASARKDLAERVTALLRNSLAHLPPDIPLFTESEDYRQRVSNLLRLAAGLLNESDDKQVKLLLLLSLFRAETSKNGDLAWAVKRSFQFVLEQLAQLPRADRISVASLSDARNAHLHLDGEAHVIITSPPYINVFNYHQNHRALLELIGFDMLKVAHSEMGSNRKHRGNRFLTVIQYSLDIELAIKSFALALVPNGLLIMVVGRESRIRGVAFGNSKIVASLIERSGAFAKPKSHERVFTNRYGQSIHEDILIAQRIGLPDENEQARDVARTSLSVALEDQAGDVRANIKEAVSLIDSVCPSPLFNKTALI